MPRLILPHQLESFVKRMKGNHPAVIVITEKHTLGYIASKRDFDLCHRILEDGEDEHTLRVDIVRELAGMPPIPTLGKAG